MSGEFWAVRVRCAGVRCEVWSEKTGGGVAAWNGGQWQWQWRFVWSVLRRELVRRWMKELGHEGGHETEKIFAYIESARSLDVEEWDECEALECVSLYDSW